MTATAITECLNGIVLALTPVQRWEAAREFNSSFMAQREFIIIAVAAIVILTAVLAIVSFRRIRQERKNSNRLFVEYAKKRGLAAREQQILRNVASKAGLKRSESIFTLASAFDRGVAKVKESFVGQQASEKANQLRKDLSFIREKLGFKKRLSHARRLSGRSTDLSSRQIPVGKKVYLIRQNARYTSDIESTVIKSSDDGLAIRLENIVTITFGEFWCVRYYFGASVWEFDTSVVSYDGDMLVLNHSDDVRFINRRAFLRVPVEMSALIAKFPFERLFIESSKSSKEVSAVGDNSAKTSVAAWGPPEFVPAVITELAGPGLRIESQLEVEVKDRVLVVFNLGQKRISNIAKQGINAARLKMAEDIGEVRHVKRTQNGFSIAVELIGLSDSNVDELIRVTNAASLNVSNRNILVSEDAVGHVPERTGIQGA